MSHGTFATLDTVLVIYIADVYFDHTSMQLAANYFDFPLSHPVPPDSTGFHWIPAGTGVIVT